MYCIPIRLANRTTAETIAGAKRRPGYHPYARSQPSHQPSPSIKLASRGSGGVPALLIQLEKASGSGSSGGSGNSGGSSCSSGLLTLARAGAQANQSSPTSNQECKKNLIRKKSCESIFLGLASWEFEKPQMVVN
jgi:hypothetical protein